MTNKRDVVSRSAHKLYDQEVQCGVSGQPRDTVASKCSAMSPVSPEILWPASVVCMCLWSASFFNSCTLRAAKRLADVQVTGGCIRR